MTNLSKATEFAQLRDRVLSLAALQRQLRGALIPKLPQKTSDAAKAAGVDWVAMNDFRTKNKPVMSGQRLLALTTFAGLPMLAPDITALADQIPDRWQALSSYSDTTIRVVFRIQEAFAQTNERLSLKQFCRLFGANAGLVGDLFWNKHKALQMVTDDLASELNEMLANQHWGTIGPEDVPAEASLPPPAPPKTDAAILRESLDQLRTRYPHTEAMYQAVKLHHSTVDRCLAGKSKPETVKTLLNKVQSALAATPSKASPEPAEPPTAPSPSTDTDARDLINHSLSIGFSVAGLLKRIRPDQLLDGDRERFLQVIQQMAAGADITPETIKRLRASQPLGPGDHNIIEILGALGSPQTRRR